MALSYWGEHGGDEQPEIDGQGEVVAAQIVGHPVGDGLQAVFHGDKIHGEIAGCQGGQLFLVLRSQVFVEDDGPVAAAGIGIDHGRMKGYRQKGRVAVVNGEKNGNFGDGIHNLAS